MDAIDRGVGHRHLYRGTDLGNRDSATSIESDLRSLRGMVGAMTGLNPHQFRSIIVDPVLRDLGLWSEAAARLVWGTAVHESKLAYLVQVPSGPALGLYQIEPATHGDLYRTYLAARSTLKGQVTAFLAQSPTPDAQLATNLAYATAICRVLYYRVPDSLPEVDDVDGLAAYWKAHYNTPSGRGTAAQWAQHYREVIS